MSFTLEPGKAVVSSTPSLLDEKKPGRIFVRENDLTDAQLAGLNYVEQTFWVTGEYPSAEQIRSHTPLGKGDSEAFYKNEKVLECMEGRNLDIKKITGSDGALTHEQLLAANMILNLEDPNSLRQKLKALNISVQKYNTWMRDPAFYGYIRARTEAMFAGADAMAFTGLIKAVQDQDIPAIKLFFEMRGIYNPRLQLDVNIQSVMVKVVEVISNHVQDKQTLLAIANDLEELSGPN